jgi:hypothetical protein
MEPWRIQILDQQLEDLNELMRLKGQLPTQSNQVSALLQKLMYWRLKMPKKF